jgi:hypothetical protein
MIRTLERSDLRQSLIENRVFTSLPETQNCISAPARLGACYSAYTQAFSLDAVAKHLEFVISGALAEWLVETPVTDSSLEESKSSIGAA